MICANCAPLVCTCGFVATVLVAVLGSGNLPPSRVVEPIMTATVAMTGAISVMVDDQISGQKYSVLPADDRSASVAACGF
jgi:hypothetical protein